LHELRAGPVPNGRPSGTINSLTLLWGLPDIEALARCEGLYEFQELPVGVEDGHGHVVRLGYDHGVVHQEAEVALEHLLGNPLGGGVRLRLLVDREISVAVELEYHVDVPLLDVGQTLALEKVSLYGKVLSGA
jgi:hypothetical protein